ncbi:MAG: 50S ribosomal protein L32 [Planctomycetota bacterium]|nr:MAG: 50S ribosomal protein L32 [Planctomycetota bacterium]
MGTPRKRKSHSRIRMRRSHHALRRQHLASCPRCGQERRPHRICDHCGFYRDRTVVDVEAEAE